MAYLKSAEIKKKRGEIVDIFEVFYNNRNEEQAVPMAKYMKNNFPYLGLKSPERKILTKNFLGEKKKDKEVDWEFVYKCFDLPEREFQYLAIGYMDRIKDLFISMDMEKIEKLITTKSWWDSVDSLAPIVGYICMKYPEVKEDVVYKWIYSDNMWLNRVSIIFQLKYKEKTDTEFLENAILSNSDTKEFFKNKAIGWALREYSKTNKEWVRVFIDTNSLSNLSISEGSKYI